MSADLKAAQAAQAAYDAMTDDSLEDGDPILAALDDLISDANRCRELVEKGQFEQAQSLSREMANTANYVADLAQGRID